MNLEISIMCHGCKTVIARGQLITQTCPHVQGEIGERAALTRSTGLPAQHGADHRPDPEPGQVSGAAVAAFTVEQVADMLNIGRDKVYCLLRTQQLRSLKIGKLRRITNAQLADFIAAAEDTHR